MLLAELGQFTGYEGIHSGADIWTIAAMINLDAGLIKSHERTKPHASGNQYFNPFLLEVIYRGHTPPLLVGHIGDDIHLLYFTVLDGNQCVEITMPEMGAHNRFKSTRISGWYGNQRVHIRSLSSAFTAGIKNHFGSYRFGWVAHST
jgi:hypothetical protein